MKGIIKLIAVLTALCLATVAWTIFNIYSFAHGPAGDDATPVVFTVAHGEPFSTLSERLAQSEIITSVRRFKLLARLKDEDKRLKAGEYALTRTMTPLQVLDTLVNGKVLLYRLTIPEGYNISQIAEEIQKSGLADGEKFRALASDPKSAETYGVSGPSLEGYLFPDTYYFPKGVEVETIVKTMVDHFKAQYPEAWRERAKMLGMTQHQIVTLASIIEKETGDPAERPLISSVFHNRLKKKMRLETDPTVIYGIENFDGNITRRHLRTATPYNTYVIKGLPPGPIANPGRAAIEAALYPAKSDYLFFVSKKDGTHHFSETIKEHTRAVRKYQLSRRRR